MVERKILRVLNKKKHQLVYRSPQEEPKRFGDKSCTIFIGKYGEHPITARLYKKKVDNLIEEEALSLGEKILKYIGKFEKNDLVLHIFDDYWLNLKELKYLLDHPTTTNFGEIKANLGDVSIADGGRPVKWGLVILRDVLEALESLTAHDLLHGDLNIRNVVVQLNSGTNMIVAKLTGMQHNARKLADHRKQFESYGNIFRYTLGVGADGYYTPEARDLLNTIDSAAGRRFGWPLKSEEWKEMQRETFRSFCKHPMSLINHPAHWVSSRGIYFLCNSSILVSACKKKLKEQLKGQSKGRATDYRPVERFIRAVNRVWLGNLPEMERFKTSIKHLKGRYMMRTINWQNVLKERCSFLFTAEISEDKYVKRAFNRAHGTDVTVLLKLISHLFTHQPEKDDDVRKALATHDAFYGLFRDLFPHLLIQVYRVVRSHQCKLELALPDCIVFESLKKDTLLEYGFP